MPGPLPSRFLVVQASPPSRTTVDGVSLATPTDVTEEPGELIAAEAVRLARSANPRFSSPKSVKGTWIRCFLAVFLLCVAWVLATPLGAAPDEPAQIVKAAATVRGRTSVARRQRSRPP
jgi:hypothetical protein